MFRRYVSCVFLYFLWGGGGRHGGGCRRAAARQGRRRGRPRRRGGARAGGAAVVAGVHRIAFGPSRRGLAAVIMTGMIPTGADGKRSGENRCTVIWQKSEWNLFHPRVVKAGTAPIGVPALGAPRVASESHPPGAIRLNNGPTRPSMTGRCSPGTVDTQRTSPSAWTVSRHAWGWAHIDCKMNV